ncbi:MAG: hypothetical protein J0M26_02170 [Planctomycetes bacterium]|nr:hypothetical protein [Planctomycetota bacterium]
MKLVADNPCCQLCDRPAIIELRDSIQALDALHCQVHKPDLWPRKLPHLSIRRFRSDPDSITCRLMEMPEDSPEHTSFREEVCDLLILGGEGACRYYLSKLTNSNQFALWNTEFEDNAYEYLLAATNGAAKSFEVHCNVGLLRAVFKLAFEGSRQSRAATTKQERAVVLLVNHLTWSDDAIAEKVPTTVKQLKRNCDYNALRASIKTRRDIGLQTEPSIGRLDLR